MTDEPAKRCPQCGGARLVRDRERGELVCAGCGLVIEDTLLDAGPDWRAHDADRRRHAGPPLTETLHDRGISSQIGKRDLDASGRQLSPEQAARFRRLRRWSRRLPNHERTLTEALQEQGRMCSLLGLPRDVREEAARVFREVRSRLLRGRSIECAAAAALYLACRERGIRRSLEEFAARCGIEPKKLRRAYLDLLWLRPRPAGSAAPPVPPVSPAYYVSEAALKLGLSGSLRRRALELAEGRAASTEREARKIAAEAIYRACGGLWSQKEIAECVNLSRVTVIKLLKRAAGEENGGKGSGGES